MKKSKNRPLPSKAKAKLPPRDPLDRTMARASALVWPNSPQPTPFCDRNAPQYKTFKAKLASVAAKLARAFATYWKDLSVDSLPYSDELDSFMRKNWPTLRPSYQNAVRLTLYLTALRLRKTGSFTPKKPAKAKPKTKVRAKAKAHARGARRPVHKKKLASHRTKVAVAETFATMPSDLRERS